LVATVARSIRSLASCQSIRFPVAVIVHEEAIIAMHALQVRKSNSQVKNFGSAQVQVTLARWDGIF
jgi:hypothetical protein